MDSLFESLYREWLTWSPTEMTAVVLAVMYLALAIRENIWCWLCAAASTALYVGLFLKARLYMESALNVFYFGMAVYGWRSWRQGGSAGTGRPVCTWPLATHGAALTMIAAGVIVSGGLLGRFTDAALPYLDSATTFTAFWATFLVARKVLENWWYWLIIDSVSIGIYLSRGLDLTALLFVLYVILIPFGLLNWTRSYRRSGALRQA